jgi:Putative type VII ESX secretion system translocon, EccE
VSEERGTASSRTYAGWQQEKVAFIFGLNGARATMLGAAILAAIFPIATTTISAAMIFWPAALVLAAAALVRVAGRTADEWLIAAASYTLGAIRRQHKFTSGPFRPGTAQPADPDLPGILAPVRILAVPAGTDRELAVACNHRAGTHTAVAKVRFPGIGLADSARRDQRVAGWGALIAGLCTEGNPITRIQALQRIVPESGAALRHWHQTHQSENAPELARQITGQLLATTSLASARRESYLAFTMDQRRAHAAIKAAGGGESGSATVLLRHLRALTSAISGAELTIEDWLGPRDLAEVIRTAYDPDAQAQLDIRRATATSSTSKGEEPEGLPPGVPPALAGPAYTEAQPGVYLHDGAASVTYWVQEWPRSQAYCTALAPLLGEGHHRRSFSLVFEPLSPRAAEREVMRERTARHVAIRMRQRTGQIVPEHEQAAAARARSQDAERAAGHGLVRFTAYVTVTVTDPATIEDACAALQADSAAARIEVRRMWFAQDIGFACSLPLGLGLPRRRW